MYAILRMKKIKNRQDLKAACAHNFRTMKVENADTQKTHLNLHTKHSKSYVEVVSRLENNFFNNNIEPRSNSVQAVEFVLSASPEFFDSDVDIKTWAKENYKFFAQNFRDENILNITVHLDESTPHIHILLTPITEDGRLSCKDLLGGKAKLSKLQTDYANAMKKFGLSRGIEKSKAKHTTIKQFYALANKIKNLNKQQLQQLTDMLNDFDIENRIDSKFNNLKLLKTINKVKSYIK